ncbi:MAG TPA: sodium:solute symporter [Pseudonocardiaceae bacterium]|nr:sodium:solute symporter [Pseudonocardiaceae bacterium]
MTGSQWTELSVFVVLFLVVTVLGFMAARWNRGSGGLHQLEEWGLGGRRFGSWVTWFLVGGDLYTAYTFVAVPALVFGAGALGFYALPYTVVLYPIVFLPVVRLWSVSRAHGYVTPADFVQGRYGSPLLAFLIAITGIVATMPYIALQLAGIEAVLRTIGLNTTGILGHLPLIIAFVILAVYTYSSGLRAPALIAFVKDILIYIVILVAIIYLPAHFGGWAHIFSQANTALQKTNPTTGKPFGSITLTNTNQLQYATLALGSALALFLYPHSVTGVLASRSRTVIKRNMVALPAYSLLLGLLALLGYIALAAGIKPLTKTDTNTIVPELFNHSFPAWFAGIAFAAIGIGALVPAAIMSIAAANLWTRNIYKAYLRRDATVEQEGRQAKLASLVVKLGAVLFAIAINPAFSIDLQLIGGVLILQTLPSVAIALYTRWLQAKALIAGWVVGMGWGVYLLYTIPAATGKGHFGGSALALGKLSLFGWHPFGTSTVQIYVGIVALIANLVVAVVVTVIARAMGAKGGVDETSGTDYHTDAPEPAESTLATTGV